MVSSTERRAAPRAPLDADAVVHHGGEQIFCRTMNLSSKGMALFSPVQRQTGSLFFVVFQLPNGYGDTRVHARLVRRESFHGRFILGLQFKDLDDGTRQRLQGYVEERLQTGA
jgi:hypothetical protein